jgi:hypothetical protein
MKRCKIMLCYKYILGLPKPQVAPHFNPAFFPPEGPPVSNWDITCTRVWLRLTSFCSSSAVQTPGFSAPGKKTLASAENFQLRQIRENSKFNGNFTFQSGYTIFFFILTLRMNISHYVCGEPTQYQCEYLLFRRWIQVFSPMSDSSLQHK